MKNHFYSFALAVALFVTTSCSSDDQSANTSPVPFAEENPWLGLLAETDLGQTTLVFIDDNNYYDMGMAFIPTVKGQINSFVVKLPESHNNIRISLWDRTTAEILRTEYIDVLVANTDTKLEILPLQLQKDKEYVVAITSDDYYMLFQENGSAVTYPVSVGNITVTGGTDQLANAQQMPEFYTANAISGIVSFNFQQTE